MYNINDSSRLDKPFSISTLESYDAKMKFEYFTIWKQNLKNSRKLEFYQNFKKRYEAENYLEIIRNFDQRRQLTKFQGPRRGRGWGGFSLPTFLKIIKSYWGRSVFSPPPPPPHFESLVSPPTFKVAPRALNLDWVATSWPSKQEDTAPKKPRFTRHWVLCNRNKIETEEHLFLKCSLYSKLRTDFFHVVDGQFNFVNPNSSEYIYALLSTNDQFLIYMYSVSKFIYKFSTQRVHHTRNGPTSTIVINEVLKISWFVISCICSSLL